MKYHLLHLLLWLSSISTASAIGTYSSGDKLYVWAYHGLSLRSAPNPKAARQTTIPYGQAITVLDSVRVKAYSVEEFPGFSIKGYWSKVRFDTLEGWVFDGYLSRFPAMREFKNEVRMEDFQAYATREFGLVKKERLELVSEKACQDLPHYQDIYTFSNQVIFEHHVGEGDNYLNCDTYYYEMPNLSMEEAMLMFVLNDFMANARGKKEITEADVSIEEQTTTRLSVTIEEMCNYLFEKKGSSIRIKTSCPF